MSTSAISEFEPLSVMVSSRCRDRVKFNEENVEMGIVRKAIKQALEDIEPWGSKVFDVWIHEDESQSDASETTWDVCMRRARQADLVLVLYNGNSGWSGSQDLVRDYTGICHAEFSEAFNKCPEKVRTIQFQEIVKAKPESPDGRFQRYFSRQNVPGTQVQTGDQAVEAALQLALGTVLSLARAGVGAAAKGRFYAGEALQWTRLDFHQRREVTRRAIVEFLQSRAGSVLAAAKDATTVTYSVRSTPIAFVCDCIPGSLGTAGARELVGQPFLRDHLLVPELPDTVAGPVHVIACQQGVTQTQAIRQLGFPDAIVVPAPFGVYIADSVQKIQMVFLSNCRDETTTRERMQRFLNWISEQEEDLFLVKRAMARRRIADEIARHGS